MNAPPPSSPQQHAIHALSASDSQVRLQAAVALGTHPDPDCLDTLVERCAVEPDFYVRDMLTWAIIRLPPEITLPRMHRELDSDIDQARSQALHTLSKIGDTTTWPWITRSMLRDPDDEVAQTAWRAAVNLVPDTDKHRLAVELASQLGRGNRSVQLSLSRSMIELGDAIDTVLADAVEHPDPATAAHARSTLLLQKCPETGSTAASARAMRRAILGPGATLPDGTPMPPDDVSGVSEC